MNILYPFAQDENGNLINIKDISPENRYEHVYTCPGCKQEMRPRLGLKNAHCFYHFNSDACGIESYIHQVGKILLIKRFYDPSYSFIIKYEQDVQCYTYSHCTYKNTETYLPCVHDIPKSIMSVDLKKYYDTAEIEKEHKDNQGKTYRADVMLTNKEAQNRPPFFIEICFKHPCTEDKISSGIKIMEIKIESVQELNNLLSCEEFDSTTSINTIKFYNLKQNLIPRETILNRLIEYKNLIPCTKEYQIENSSFIREIFFLSGGSFRKKILFDEPHFEYSWFEIEYNEKIAPSGFIAKDLVAAYVPLFRTCHQCLECKTDFWSDVVFCKFNGTTRKGTFNQNKAKHCQYYRSNYDNYMFYYPEIFFRIWINPKHIDKTNAFLENTPNAR